jgi:hypothetical protein
LKHFEAFLNSWVGWTDNETTKITKNGKIVTISNILKDHPNGLTKSTTIVDLSKVAAYAFAE